MAKKKKRGNKEKIIKRRIKLPENELKIEKVLIENFVSFQRVMVNLSVKFDNLTNQISKLLDLFEISAKVLAEKDFDLEGNKRDNSKITEKLESIMDQNRTIARGLTLMHDKISSLSNSQTSDFNMARSPMQKLPVKPLPRTAIHQRDEGEYHKSISSDEQRI